MAEPPLLSLQHVREAFELVVAGAVDSPSSTAVVDEGVGSFLKHSLLVSDDDLRRAQLDQSLETVVAVDHPAIEVVQVAGGKASPVELNHRPQIWRNDR